MMQWHPSPVGNDCTGMSNVTVTAAMLCPALISRTAFSLNSSV